RGSIEAFSCLLSSLILARHSSRHLRVSIEAFSYLLPGSTILVPITTLFTAEALIILSVILPVACNDRHRQRGIMCYPSKYRGSARPAWARLDNARVRQVVPPWARFTGLGHAA